LLRKTQKAEFGTIYIDRDGVPDSYTEGVVIGNGMIHALIRNGYSHLRIYRSAIGSL